VTPAEVRFDASVVVREALDNWLATKKG